MKNNLKNNDKQTQLNEYRKLYLNSDGVFNKLKEIHKDDPFTIENITDKNSKVCFVFSCPGRAELIAGAPCQGATGDNLNILLEILNEKFPDLFESKNKDSYDILNATTRVHFYALDHKTEASTTEIKNNSNKIKDYLENNKNFEFAIIFGEKAKKLEELFDEKFIESRHLGFQSINQIKVDEEITDKTRARLQIVANDIEKQMLTKKIISEK